jgi:hypothetical protein
MLKVRQYHPSERHWEPRRQRRIRLQPEETSFRLERVSSSSTTRERKKFKQMKKKKKMYERTNRGERLSRKNGYVQNECGYDQIHGAFLPNRRTKTNTESTGFKKVTIEKKETTRALSSLSFQRLGDNAFLRERRQGEKRLAEKLVFVPWHQREAAVGMDQQIDLLRRRFGESRATGADATAGWWSLEMGARLRR